jgi:hypothetical protein
MSDAQQQAELQHDPLCDKLAMVLTTTIATQYGEVPLSVALNSGDERVSGAALMHLGRMGNEVRELLVKDKRFLGDAVLQMRNEAGSSNLYPNMVGVPLLRRVLTTGSSGEAIEWLGRMLTTKDAPGKTIEALWGVPVEAEIQLLPAVKIVPIEQLPDSSQKRLLMNNAPRSQALLVTMLDYVPPRSAIVVNRVLNGVIYDPALAQADDSKEMKRIDELLGDITLVLTLVGPRVPISSAIWFEFDNPDLQQLAPLAGMRRGRGLEILPTTPTDYPPLDAAEAQELVRRFFALDDDTKKKLRVSLHRLNMAQRRRGLGDRAVELCVALESLLGGEGNNEVTHKVTVRSALLLGGSTAVRLENADVVRKTYGFRSTLVHQGKEPTGTKEINGVKTTVATVVDRAVSVCVAVIKVIIQRGRIPDWTMFDVEDHA